MEMITKKLIEKNGQAPHSNTNTPNNTPNEKAGISLNDANQQNNGDNSCCSFSL